MLGSGCPWKGKCNACHDSAFRKKYCNSASMSAKCPERPMNYGDRAVEKKYNYGKSNFSMVRMFWMAVILMAIIYFIAR